MTTHTTEANAPLFKPGFMVLHGNRLEEALEAAKDNKTYLLPERLSFVGQIREGVAIGAFERQERIPEDPSA